MSNAIQTAFDKALALRDGLDAARASNNRVIPFADGQICVDGLFEAADLRKFADAMDAVANTGTRAALPPPPIKTNDADLATTLAALRTFQRLYPHTSDRKTAAPDYFDEAGPLRDEQIDALCERLSTYGVSTISSSEAVNILGGLQVGST